MNKNGKFENIQYIQVSKNGKVLKTYKADEVNGLTKAQFQEVLGKDFGQERLSLSVNKKNSFTNTSMQIRGIILDEKNEIQKPETRSNKDEVIIGQIKMLNDKIETIKSGSGNETFSREAMIMLIKDSYEIKYGVLNEKIEDLKKEIIEYKDYIKELEDSQTNSSPDISSLLTSVMQFKNMFNAKKAKSNLKGNEQIPKDGIPSSILYPLNNIDYNAIDEKQLIDYASLLRQFAEKLPQKEVSNG